MKFKGYKKVGRGVTKDGDMIHGYLTGNFYPLAKHLVGCRAETFHSGIYRKILTKPK